MKLYHMEILSTDYVVSITCTEILDLLYLFYRKSTCAWIWKYLLKNSRVFGTPLLDQGWVQVKRVHGRNS